MPLLTSVLTVLDRHGAHRVPADQSGKGKKGWEEVTSLLTNPDNGAARHYSFGVNASLTVKKKLMECAKILYENASQAEEGDEISDLEKLGYKIYAEAQAVIEEKKMASDLKNKNKKVYMERMNAAEGALIKRPSVGKHVKAPVGVEGIPNVDEALASLSGNPISNGEFKCSFIIIASLSCYIY